MPQVWFLLGVRYHPRAVNRARRARDVIANGQFIMVHARGVRAGRHARGGASRGGGGSGAGAGVLPGGRRSYFAFAEPLMETRMYESLPHLVEGWSKNIYLGGRRSFPEEPVRRALVPLALRARAASGCPPPGAGRRVDGVGPPLAPAAAAADGTECHLLDADVGSGCGYRRLRAALSGRLGDGALHRAALDPGAGHAGSSGAGGPTQASSTSRSLTASSLSAHGFRISTGTALPAPPPDPRRRTRW